MPLPPGIAKRRNRWVVWTMSLKNLYHTALQHHKYFWCAIDLLQENSSSKFIQPYVAVEIRMYGRQNLKLPLPRDKTEQTHGKTTKQNTKRKPYNIKETEYNTTIWNETTNHRSKTTLSHYSNHCHRCNNRPLARHQRTQTRTLYFLTKFNLFKTSTRKRKRFKLGGAERATTNERYTDTIAPPLLTYLLKKI